MKTSVHSIGRWGEEKAYQYCCKLNYTIVARNFHSLWGEIDIIAQEQQTLIFIEVKTRKQRYLGTAAQAVSYHKQKRLWQTALYYLNLYPKMNDLACRFDIIEIYYASETDFTLNHLKGCLEL